MSTTVVNPLSNALGARAYFRVNRTKENETLYFLPDAPFLAILTADGKGLHFIHGDAAEFVFKKIAVDEDKKKYCKNVKRMLEIFYKKIDDASGLPFDSMAALEQIMEKLD